MRTDEKFSELEKLGAGDFSHLNGSLVDHLQGTRDLLKSWGARSVLTDAGLFHAAYGTAGFQHSLVSTDHRGRIADIVGSASEEIVYTYCSCDRDHVWPQIGRAGEIEFRDRFTGAAYIVAGAALHDFCELTVANELEIAGRDKSFIALYGAELLELFNRMAPYVSVGALAAVHNILDKGNA